MTREEQPADYAEIVAGYILLGLGVPFEQAREIAHRPLPELPPTQGGLEAESRA